MLGAGVSKRDDLELLEASWRYMLKYELSFLPAVILGSKASWMVGGGAWERRCLPSRMACLGHSFLLFLHIANAAY